MLSCCFEAMGSLTSTICIISLVPRPYILILLEYGEISMETVIVGVSMEMPSFTMTSFQSARGQVVAWWKYPSGDTDGRIAS